MSTSNKSLAKNAVFLYLRTGLSLIIQLISVRFLLKYLGVTDYGLYGLIGSVVGVVEALKGLLSSSIQRFINIAKGNGREEDIRDIFNVGLHIQICFSLILFVGTIIIGWILIPRLNIPAEKLEESYIVLICSALTMAISILTVPYDALIIAYERFKAYAYISIIYSFLKFASVIILIFFTSWRLSIYSGLLLISAILIRLISLLYCKNKFRDKTKISIVKKRYFYKEIGKFAGWKSLGTISNTILASGINFVLNIFGGLVVNTARTITYQVMTAVNVLVWNINTAFSPRCITKYGEGDYIQFYFLLSLMTKITYLINAILGFGIILFIPHILKLWLGEVPLYAVTFIRLIFLYSIAKSIQDSIDIVYTAGGKLKVYQTVVFVCSMITLLASYICLSLEYSYSSVFICMALMEVVIVVVSMVYAKKALGFNLNDYWTKVLSNIFYSVFILFGLYWMNDIVLQYIPLFALQLTISISFWIIGITSLFCLVLSKNELKQIISIIHHK